MARKIAERKSAKRAAIEVLAQKGGSMSTPEIVAAVLKTPGVKLGGKTPAATIAAILYTAPEFKKVGKAKIALSANGKKAAKESR